MERGMQIKADDNSRQRWESSDFPMLCEGCLGENPYIRMQKATHAGTCKMCERPYSTFKWRPGRGEGYKRTQICQTCAKIKNLCQSCLLDLQFGLPSQLRDAVLSEVDGTLAVPESDVNQEYFANQRLQMLASGNDPWSTGETPNEKLLKIARGVAQERSQDRVKLSNVGEKRCHGEENIYGAKKERRVEITDEVSDDAAEDADVLPAPPGYVKVGDNIKPVEEIQKSSSEVAPKKPPKPAGPPPSWAFKNKAVSTGDVASKE